MNIEKIISMIRDTEHIFFDTEFNKDVAQKGAWDYVTRADQEISKFLHEKLKEVYPDIGFVSEEEEGQAKDSCWILDPIDGTTNYMHALCPSAVSLGLRVEGIMQMGIIYIPQSKEMFWAQRGKGAYLNGERIFCSQRVPLSECLGMMEYNAYRKDEKQKALYCADQIFSTCRDIRTIGSAAASIAYVAAGRVDAFLGRHLKLWDYAAGQVLIEEAGGRMTDERGNIPQGESHILATNNFVHDEFSALLKEGL